MGEKRLSGTKHFSDGCSENLKLIEMMIESLNTPSFYF